ncbi:hypothetical protein DFJ74DRAFT_660266 [Hyaloraphidium curvatum]|nr:hypothetical protein DFJ74DRAFT_660266 [Hyaloraphidium curvatum]
MAKAPPFPALAGLVALLVLLGAALAMRADRHAALEATLRPAAPAFKDRALDVLDDASNAVFSWGKVAVASNGRAVQVGRRTGGVGDTG